MKQLFINIQEPIWLEMKAGFKNDVIESIKILLNNGFVVKLFDPNFTIILPDINSVRQLDELLKQPNNLHE